MAALSNSLLISNRPSLHFSTGSYVKPADQRLGSAKLAFDFKGTKKSIDQRRALVVQASYSDDERSSDASIFLGGLVIGGLIGGTLGCMYAPQINQALSGKNRNELMKKLPKLISEEGKVLERQRQKLIAKIEELNGAIDSMASGVSGGVSDAIDTVAGGRSNGRLKRSERERIQRELAERERIRPEDLCI